eukprot:gene1713-2590_t
MSGIGREGGPYALNNYLQVKQVTQALSQSGDMFTRGLVRALRPVRAQAARNATLFAADPRPFAGQLRWCSAAGKEAPSGIAEKMLKTDPSLYHVEANDKRLGGSGIGPGDADMALLFECRVCKTQAVKQFSKTSYNTGVVLIECPGCRNKHVIADNLGWFHDMGENNNIEKQMKAEGAE